MLIDVIRTYNKAVPFRPYQIRTKGGDVIPVPHPEFIMVAPKGSWVEVVDEKDAPRHISALLIEEVSPITPGSSSRRAKKTSR